jgi:hypothetical protein
MASFRDAAHEGGYLAQQHAVVWKLGDLEPGDSGTAAAQVEFAWGLPDDEVFAAQARLGGTNLPLSLPNPEWYMASVPVDLLGATPLTEAELAAERLAYPDLDLIYIQAEADGFLPGGALRLVLDAAEPITQVVLLRRAGQEVMYLRRQGEQVLASTFGLTSYAVRQAAGGLALDVQTLAETFWGAWGSGETPSQAGLAYSNCRYARVPALVLGDKLATLAQVLGSAACYPCLSGGDCTGCFAALQGVVPLPEAGETLACAAGAGAAGNSGPDWWLVPPNLPYCPDGEHYARCTHSWWTRRWYVTYYPCVQGVVTWHDTGGLWIVGPLECDKYQTCVEGPAITGYWNKVGCQCVPVYLPPDGGAGDLSAGFPRFTPSTAWRATCWRGSS